MHATVLVNPAEAGSDQPHRHAPLRYASPMDAHAHGAHQGTDDRAHLPDFRGRLGADGARGWRAEPGRYHLYAGWSCPASQRDTIALELNGLTQAVSVSYVDGLRDARGWAFRAPTGPDQVNGFTLLREAYEASRPGYTGRVSVPVLWDRRTERIVSNDPDTIDVDLATAFRAWGRPDVTVRPDHLAAAIGHLDSWIATTVTRVLGRAVYDEDARATLLGALRRLDRRLADRRYLLGDQLTLADVRLWVTLVRFDAGVNAHGALGAHLPGYPHLWDYARRLYALPAFRDTTRFESFTAPFAALPDWDATVENRAARFSGRPAGRPRVRD